jgi:hypothetical protein
MTELRTLRGTMAVELAKASGTPGLLRSLDQAVLATPSRKSLTWEEWSLVGSVLVH